MKAPGAIGVEAPWTVVLTVLPLGAWMIAPSSEISTRCYRRREASRVGLSILRSEGLAVNGMVLDADAHPPDGLAACFRGDPRVWIDSLSGSQWATRDRRR